MVGRPGFIWGVACLTLILDISNITSIGISNMVGHNLGATIGEGNTVLAGGSIAITVLLGIEAGSGVVISNGIGVVVDSRSIICWFSMVWSGLVSGSGSVIWSGLISGGGGNIGCRGVGSRLGVVDGSGFVGRCGMVDWGGMVHRSSMVDRGVFEGGSVFPENWAMVGKGHSQEG